MKRALFLVIIGLVVILAGYYFIPEPVLPKGKAINKLIVYKDKHIMEAYADNTLLKAYKIAIGKNPVGDKQEEGDLRTPEGKYYINNKNPHSGFHKNLGISYPNKSDIADAKRRHVATGGDIKIHGLKNGHGYISKFHRFTDWTNGCIALTDEEVDELYESVKIGAVIIINP